MKTEVILIFDIGKTNKKVLLFNRDLKIVFEKEEKFDEITDDDGFACDDISKIENWILSTCSEFLDNKEFNVRGINFTTYGATLMYVNKSGQRLTPVYNYLKPMPEGIVEPLYEKYGGIEEFSRKTASPALGMLNSGLQALWLKKAKGSIFEETHTILHFPQYLSFLLTGEISSEHTSIGCHTALWDFDQMKYHDWVSDEEMPLPDPVPLDSTFPAVKIRSDVPVGIGIHDSSASLAPYFGQSENAFILISTGTWCINMNPFNYSPLTSKELEQDCLAYMSVKQKPVKSSRFFLGHIHDVNVDHLIKYFNVGKDQYKSVSPDQDMLDRLMKEEDPHRSFFSEGIPEDYVDKRINLSMFENFIEAYHRLMIDLVNRTAESIDLVIEEGDTTRDIYITGGFAKNPIFVKLLASRYSGKNVYTSEIANATSLGAALVVWNTMGMEGEPEIDLGLKKI
jgi:sugar (pentulose or hexulose) kinase